MKQMPPAVAQRRWLFNALFASGQIVAEIVFGLLGSAAGWALCASVPLAVVSWTAWWLNLAVRRRQERPDYARIALLERELLDIEAPPAVATVQHRTNPHSTVVFLSTTHGIKPGWFELRAPDGATEAVRAHSVTACALHLTAALEREFPAGTRVVSVPAPERPVPPPGRGAGSPTTR